MEEIIKELGTKIDAMKNESVTKTELIEVMSKIADLQAKGNDVDALKANIEEVAIKVLDLQTKGTANNVPESLETLLKEKQDELKAMK